jgi:hypothetical protein
MTSANAFLKFSNSLSIIINIIINISSFLLVKKLRYKDIDLISVIERSLQLPLDVCLCSTLGSTWSIDQSINLLIIVLGVHWDIYQSSYNIS